MKKLLLSLALALLFLNCGDSGDEKKVNSSDQEVAVVKKPAGPVLKLRYKFNPGDKFSYKLQTVSNNTEEISADTTLKNEIIQNATYKMDFTVKNVDDMNNANIQVRISSIKAETIFNGQTIKYDSKFIYSTRERVQFVDYEAVKKVPFNITVTEMGQVVRVDNTKKIMRNFLEIQQVPDTLSPDTKEKMLLTISNGTLMPLTQQIFKVVSDDEVGIDSTWQLKYSTPLAVFEVENTAIFKINDLIFGDDTTASISSNLLIKAVGNNIVNENGVTYSFAQPQLDANGTINYNHTKGLVEMAESVTRLEMMMYMDGVDNNNNPIKSTKRDVSNNTNIVELL